MRRFIFRRFLTPLMAFLVLIGLTVPVSAQHRRSTTDRIIRGVAHGLHAYADHRYHRGRGRHRHHRRYSHRHRGRRGTVIIIGGYRGRGSYGYYNRRGNHHRHRHHRGCPHYY